jgi:hypothetical protein
MFRRKRKEKKKKKKKKGLLYSNVFILKARPKNLGTLTKADKKKNDLNVRNERKAFKSYFQEDWITSILGRRITPLLVVF